MADPTVADVQTMVATLAGDESKEIFTDARILVHYKTAFRDYYRLAQQFNLPKIQRTVYYNLPAYRSVLTPSQFSVTDFGSPTKIWERGDLTTGTVSGATDATPIVLTVSGASSSFSTNNEITVHGVVGPTGRINDRWFITVSGDSVTLNGSVAAGSYTSGGTITKSGEDFEEMISVDRLPDDEPTTELTYWNWREHALYLIGSTETRQLKIEYESNGAPPASGTVGIEDGLDYLAYRSAGLLAASVGMDSQAQTWTAIALGPSMQVDGSGGLLRDLILPLLQEKNKRPKRPGLYRPRRVLD